MAFDFYSLYEKKYFVLTLLVPSMVLFILGLLAAALVPSVLDVIEKARNEAEKRALDDLAGTITASFDTIDLTSLNIAALPGTIGAADTATEFSISSTAPYAATPFVLENSSLLNCSVKAAPKAKTKN